LIRGLPAPLSITGLFRHAPAQTASDRHLLSGTPRLDESGVTVMNSSERGDSASPQGTPARPISRIGLIAGPIAALVI
jgi:hypothetical protein